MPSCETMHLHPVGHVPAVARAQGSFAVLVDEREFLLGFIQSKHEIGEGLAAPVAVHAIDNRLPVAGRAARIDHHHHVAVRGKQFRVPAVAPRIAPSPLRPAVDKELDRVFLGRIEARGPNDEALQLGLVGCGEPEVLHLRQIELGEKGLVQVGKVFAFRPK